jgi:hypothetical protein
MKINKKVKTFEEYQKDIDDIFSKEEIEETQDVEDIKKSTEEIKEEEEIEDEKELEEEEEETIWGDENMVERFKTFEENNISKKKIISNLTIQDITNIVNAFTDTEIPVKAIIEEIFDILNDNNKISEQYTKSEYFEQSEIDELKKLLPQLKQANNILNRQEIINWFNENDIDYFNMTDMEMFIYYIENN